MTRGRPEYTPLDHTADAAVLVRAPDPRALFERAALAMLDLGIDVAAVSLGDLEGEGQGERTSFEVAVTAADREELLVGFLGEVLAQSILRGVAVGAVDVTELSFAPARVTARLFGEPLDLHRHGFRSELKAVTYHHLLVSEDADGWSARVVVDI